MSEIHPAEVALVHTPDILIVDDEPAIRDLLCEQLRSQGYTITTSSDGHSAMAELEQRQYDLVLLDIGLPDVDGFEVLQHLERHAPSTEVVVITGKASIESAVEALRRGAYSYLRKPFSREELLRTTANAIEHRQLARDRNRSEQELRESESRFRTLVENSLIGISIIQKSKAIYHNPQQRQLIDAIAPSFTEQPSKHVHPDDLEKVTRLLENLLSGKIESAETDFRFSPSGTIDNFADTRWVRCRASHFKYLGEDALLLNTLDITRAKELEQLLLIKHKMASLGRVAAGIAHEIRNPLTGINSYVYTLKDIADAEKIDPQDIPTLQQIARQIQVASNKIDAVIQRVLDFARPNVPRMVKIDVNQPVKAAIELTAVTLRKSDIQLEARLDPNLPQCFADKHMIEQVVLNMINNAAKVMEGLTTAKQIEIVSYTREGQVCIRLSDSGPGIPADLSEKIFDPFFTTHSDGSGIGLSIAQRIIADHNGKIRVGSSRWGGAEFVIELPIEKRITPR